MKIVTTSVTIGFTKNEQTDANFSAEVDTRDNGLNEGNTSFKPGDSVGILLYKGLTIANVKGTPTSGLLTEGALIDVEQEETISFANEDSFSARYPVNSGTASIEWYSTAPTVTIPTTGSAFTTANKVIAVGLLKYKTKAQVWTLSGVPVAYPSALVVFTGEAP